MRGFTQCGVIITPLHTCSNVSSSRGFVTIYLSEHQRYMQESFDSKTLILCGMCCTCIYVCLSVCLCTQGFQQVGCTGSHWPQLPVDALLGSSLTNTSLSCTRRSLIHLQLRMLSLVCTVHFPGETS